MNRKRHGENKQLSLTFELPLQMSQVVVVCSTVSLMQQRSASVISFPADQSQRLNFRERVIQDLIKTRVMVAD